MKKLKLLKSIVSTLNRHLQHYVKSKVVELLHQIVELLQYFRFAFKNFFLTCIDSIFAL